MEMESVPLSGDWVEESDLADAEGTYYTFNGNGICSGRANSPLRYTFRIKNGGIWNLHLRCARRWLRVAQFVMSRSPHCSMHHCMR